MVHCLYEKSNHSRQNKAMKTLKIRVNDIKHTVANSIEPKGGVAVANSQSGVDGHKT